MRNVGCNALTVLDTKNLSHPTAITSLWWPIKQQVCRAFEFSSAKFDGCTNTIYVTTSLAGAFKVNLPTYSTMPINSGMLTPTTRDVAISRDGYIYTTTDQGIWRSTNANSVCTIGASL